MKTSLPYPDKLEIAEAVSHALQNALRILKQPEPQLVANLVYELPKRINEIVLSGSTKIKAGGVFVHARPFVTCSSFPESSPQSVEIGDLLLIRTLVVHGKVEERRVLLLQAKKVDGIPAEPDNKNQWHLYEKWPRFTYAKRSGGLTGKARRIKEPDMYDAAKYLLINSSAAARYHFEIEGLCYWYRGWPEVCMPLTAQPTKPEISRYRCFLNEIVEFLAGNAGKAFDKPMPRTLGWDRVIKDLIDETAKAKTIYMGRTKGGSSKLPRGVGVLFMTTSIDDDYFLIAGNGGTRKYTIPLGAPDNLPENGGEGSDNSPPQVPNEWPEDGDDGGISIIEFVVEQGEG